MGWNPLATLFKLTQLHGGQRVPPPRRHQPAAHVVIGQRGVASPNVSALSI